MKPMNAQCPMPGNRERPAEQVAVRLDDRQQQNGKAPERQGMRHARHRPLQQLALPDHLDGLRRHVPAGMLAHGLDPLRSGLPAERQPLQPPQPAPGDRERDHSQHQADGHPQDHANLLNIRSSSVAAQARRDMITSAQTPSTCRADPSRPGRVISLIAYLLNYLNLFFRTTWVSRVTSPLSPNREGPSRRPVPSPSRPSPSRPPLAAAFTLARGSPARHPSPSRRVQPAQRPQPVPAPMPEFRKHSLSFRPGSGARC